MPRSAAQLALAWDETRSSALASKQAKEAPGRLHMSALRFNSMHFMPYAHLPENHKELKSVWVDFSNRNYDPDKGYDLYQRYIKELVLADQLGFDAIVVNEHHNTAYSMMAAPNLIAAAVIPQTKNARICVWGTPPN